MTKQFNWYVVYTSSRAEKKVKERLEEQGIICYLPLKTSIRQWSDRKKKVYLPLIPSYIFLYITSDDFSRVLFIPGIINFIKEKNIPAFIPDYQIERLKLMLERSEEEIEFTSLSLSKGDNIRIIKGGLTGLIGELVEIQGKHKIAVRLEKLGFALSIVPISFIEKLEVSQRI
ncbi:MAG: UpxY family transcription antiterminator [Odoribacter sp.]|nr:UpxY family transcription antiterminator [Odoribacter sp.]